MIPAFIAFYVAFPDAFSNSASLVVPALAAAAGLLLGSFLNVCIARLPSHRSIAWPGSHCPRCKAPIRPWDNIPLLSYAVLRGRCRACRQAISPRYPLVEAALAALFAACAWSFGPSLLALEAETLCFLLLGLLVMDLETQLLPDAFTWVGIALGLGQSLLPGHGLIARLHLLAHCQIPVPHWPAWQSSLVGGVGAAALLLAIRWVYWLLRRHHGMGLGDVKLAAMLGCWLGGAGAGLALFLGILLGAAVGSVLLGLAAGQAETSRREVTTLRLPFGTFLCAAALYVLFSGQKTLTLYFSFWP